jgi:hypothetical protein
MSDSPWHERRTPLAQPTQIAETGYYSRFPIGYFRPINDFVRSMANPRVSWRCGVIIRRAILNDIWAYEEPTSPKSPLCWS